MSMQAESGSWALTEKEKQTLRLIVRGHDAKSVARNLGLSVHTINERLRDARRKMAVSSSREAARLLLEAEDGARSPTPDLLRDVEIGEDESGVDVDQAETPISGVRPVDRSPRLIIGVLLMTFALGLLALAVLPPAGAPPSAAPTVLQTAPDAAVVDAARQWLVLVDQARWDDSYRGTGTAFQKLNTAEVWAATSEKVRVPLGAVLSRTFVSQQDLPAPPAGYQVVKFRTRFANKADAIETVSLEREGGAWRIVGVTIE
jgi:DNA-binding CsgD family transcriptional regulator